MLQKSNKIISSSIKKVGDFTYSFIRNGEQPLFKRQGIITCNSSDEVNFDQATSLAIRYGFMGELLKWFEKHKSWKEGAYIDRY